VVIQVLNLIEIMLFFDFTVTQQEGRSNYGIAVAPKQRVNDKFSIYLIDYTNKTNDLGFGFESSDIIIEKEIEKYKTTCKYSINDKMTLNLTARYYYWS
jgi:hypothetical protein